MDYLYFMNEDGAICVSVYDKVLVLTLNQIKELNVDKSEVKNFDMVKYTEYVECMIKLQDKYNV